MLPKMSLLNWYGASKSPTPPASNQLSSASMFARAISGPARVHDRIVTCSGGFNVRRPRSGTMAEVAASGEPSGNFTESSLSRVANNDLLTEIYSSM